MWCRLASVWLIRAHPDIIKSLLIDAHSYLCFHLSATKTILISPLGEQKLHPSCLQTTSFAAAIAGASLLKSPLYLHLASTYFPETQRFTMPTPVVSVLTGGHLGCGKLKIREFCLTPLPGITFPDQIRSLLTVHQEVGKVLSAKSGVSSNHSVALTLFNCCADS